LLFHNLAIKPRTWAFNTNKTYF